MSDEKRLIVKAIRKLEILEAQNDQPLIRETIGILWELYQRHE